MAEGGAHPPDLVGRDGLSLPAAAHHDGEVGVAAGHPPPRGGAQRWVVHRLLGVRAQVLHVAAGGPQVVDQCRLELIAGVVRGDGDAHGKRSSRGRMRRDADGSAPPLVAQRGQPRAGIVEPALVVA